MEGKKSGAGFLIAVVIVVWLFAFGGIAFIQGLLLKNVPPTPPPGTSLSSSITSISPGATASVVVAADGHSAKISDTSAQFAAVATVSVTLSIKHLVSSATTFQITIDNPNFQSSSGHVYNLVTEAGTPLCPSIVYTNTGGTGTSTTQPCGFYMAFNSGDAGSVVVLALTMNTATFGATAQGNEINLLIHGTGTDPLTVTWSITG